jgi:broad specificity phosphatase PhoE
MKLIITRHGETEGNVKRILAGPEDPLTSNGREQAKKVSQRLKDENISAIFSSPFIRAKETAQIIAKNHPKTPFIVADELKEGKVGCWVGLGYDEVDWDRIPEDLENRTDLFERGKAIIERVIREYPNKTVLFVAHNAINKAMIKFLRKLDPEDKGSLHQDNTAISIFDISEGKCVEVLVNCTKHLE